MGNNARLILRWRLRYALATIFIIPLMLLLVPKLNLARFSYSPKFFAIREIEVNDPYLQPYIEMEFLGSNIFAINFERIQHYIAQQRQFNHLHIRKILPSKLVIDIEANQPMAYLQQGETRTFYDQEGQVAYGTVPTLDQLTEVEGQASSTAMKSLFLALQSAELEVKKISFIEERRWDITLKNGVKVKLGKENYDNSLLILPELLKSDKYKDRLEKIDLRSYPKRIFLELKQDAQKQ